MRDIALDLRHLAQYMEGAPASILGQLSGGPCQERQLLGSTAAWTSSRFAWHVLCSALHGGVKDVNQVTPSEGTARPSLPLRETTSGRTTRHILVVEPEALVRWSLGKYLSRWFVVHFVESRAAADQVLEDHPVCAVIVSYHRDHRLAEDVETVARSRNQSIRVIRTVTQASEDRPDLPDTLYVEKPFELADLASMLGVQDTSTCH